MMIGTIEKEDPVFQSEEYQRDWLSFYVMEARRQEGAPLAGDGKSAAIAFTSSEKYPSWVWSSDSLDENGRGDLCEYCYRSVLERGLPAPDSSVKFCCKPALTPVLEARFALEGYSASRIEMESYQCLEPIAPEKMPAVSCAAMDDLEPLAELRRRFSLECFGEEREPDFTAKARQLLEAGIVRCVKLDGKMVAIANLARQMGRYVSIGGVYTLPEYRGRGLARALVYHISVEILQSGRIPCLYTDLSNPRSNYAYQAVGFREVGRVDEITFQKSGARRS